MTSTRDAWRCFVSSLAMNRFAAFASAGSDQDVEDVAVLVDGPPQVLPKAVDRHEHLVEVPLVAGSGLAASQAVRVGGSELDAPVTDRLVGDDHAAVHHEPLDLAVAEREAR